MVKQEKLVIIASIMKYFHYIAPSVVFSVIGQVDRIHTSIDAGIARLREWIKEEHKRIIHHQEEEASISLSSFGDYQALLSGKHLVHLHFCLFSL